MLGFSEACERNKDPILNILKDAFINCTKVLEIGSGTGQHSVYFGLNLPHLEWQPSDLNENLDGIKDRIELEGTDNIKQPVELDVTSTPWNVSGFDAVFSANTLHIMPKKNVEKFFNGLDKALVSGGVLCIYGPFKYKGRYTSDSNERFDEFLKERDAESGIRDFDYINSLAAKHCLEFVADHSMPANNQCIVWKKV